MLARIAGMVLQINNSFHQPSDVDRRLLVLDRFKDIILQEFLPLTLEFKDLSTYQDDYINSNGQGYTIGLEQYEKAKEQDSGWAIAPLWYDDYEYTRNSMLMPKTTKLLKWIGHTTYAGITALHPDHGLDWHHDDDPFPNKLQMRVFYTLKTCGGSYIEVEETEKRIKKRYFKEQEYIIFHSKKRHRVWNEGILPRYSLVIDVLK